MTQKSERTQDMRIREAISVFRETVQAEAFDPDNRNADREFLCEYFLENSDRPSIQVMWDEYAKFVLFNEAVDDRGA